MPLIKILAIFICLFPLTLKAQDNLVRNPQFAEFYIDYNARDWFTVAMQFTAHWNEIPLTRSEAVNYCSFLYLYPNKREYDFANYVRYHPKVRNKMMTNLEYGYDGHEHGNNRQDLYKLPLNDGFLVSLCYLKPIATLLRKPLKKGQTYEMKMRLRSGLWCSEFEFGMDTVFEDFVFLTTVARPKNIKARDAITSKASFDTLSQSRFFEQRQRDSLGWETWTCRFVASDSARYLWLGARECKKVPSKSYFSSKSSFYQCASVSIDSVSLRAMTDTETTQHYDSLEANKQLLKLLELGALGFEYNKSALSPLGKKKLDSLATALKKEPPFQKLVLDGHTDKAGSPDYNKSLAQARAKAVQNYLVSKGLATELFYLRAYGSEKPVSTKPELNRRVEIKMLR